MRSNPLSFWPTLALFAHTSGSSYADPQVSLLSGPVPGFAELPREVDAVRTAMASFRDWNLETNSLMPGMPPSRDPVTEADHGFGLIPCGPITTNGAPFDEVWEEGGEGGGWIGHTVTLAGYVDGADPPTPSPGTNCVIVADQLSQLIGQPEHAHLRSSHAADELLSTPIQA